ncbi:MAG: hypothetical protein IJI45_18290 [Anaerolineaceae bacterium]|nr:hypothetical protein [Anaerolineaceae bacterium]
MLLEADMNLSVMLDGELSIESAFDGEFGQFNAVSSGDPYTGDTDITPDSDEHVLATRGKILGEDIVIHAVPSGYGKITWNGAYLTVS